MGSIEHYNLKHLSDEDCLPLFVKHAFEGRDINAQQISEIRDKVVAKCRGLPLAARTLGGLLRSKGYDAWDGLLNNNILDFPQQNGILPVLSLSYHYLPSHLKRCFAYCAIFPKDYEFTKDELVLLWLAEGIIQQSRSDKQPEDWGSECFDDLLSRSIFQQSNGDSSKFIMHDLVHDLAQLVSKETIFRLEGANILSRRFERIRHSSYTRDWFDAKNKFEIFHKVECLRTFLPILARRGPDTSYITYNVISDLLPTLKKLRVLSLQGYHITQLPDSIQGLRLLRYLNLAGIVIRSLPESTSTLFNLQILILRDCSRLTKLPSKMKNLINLRHLDIQGANSLKEMPPGMKQLKNLQMLSNFILGKGGSVSSLKDLKNVNFLHGELCITGLENLNNSQDAREAVLWEKQNLEALSLQWGSEFDNSRDEVVEENVLDMLQPHRKIKRLTIRYYGGARFPVWIGDGLFSKMEILTLANCENCKSLPSLGLLGSLKHLTIKGLRKLESINSEFYGKGCSKLFQSLKTLHFENLPELKYWDTNIKENEQVEIFFCLRELSIVECPKLSGNQPEFLPSLEKLVVRKCALLLVPASCFPILCKLEIDECKGMVCSSTPIDCKSIKFVSISNSALEIYGCKGMLYNCPTELLKSVTISNILEFGKFLKHGFQMLDTFAIGSSDRIKSWKQYGDFEFMRQMQGLHVITSSYPKEVSIEENCLSLVSFPEVNFLPNNLRSLFIGNIGVLKSLPEEMMGNSSKLERLYVRYCNSLTFIAKRKLPSSLKRLEIVDCQKLQCLVDDEVDASSSSSSPSVTLKHLEISDCPKLKSLSSGIQLLEALEYLHISNCSNLESLPDGLHNLNCLQTIHLSNCQSLVYFPKRGLPSNISSVSISKCLNLKALPNDMHKLNSLQHLSIVHCPRIVSFPKEGFPTSLTSLVVAEIKIYEGLVKWGLNMFTSLTYLYIYGRGINAESFPDEEIGMVLPTSLSDLTIHEFQDLNYLSSMGFQSLTSLESLEISGCPKLKSFLQFGLPSSLLQLRIYNCPLIKLKCKRHKGKEWSTIAHIPFVEIDGKLIHDSKEEDQ